MSNPKAGAGGADSPLQPITDPQEYNRTLKEAAKGLSPAFLWTKGSEISVNSQINLYSEAEKQLYFWVPKGMTAPEIMDKLAEKGISEMLCNVAAPSASLFFTCKLIGVDTGTLKFHAPEKLFKVQRRQDMRLPILDSVILKADFEDPLEPPKRVQKRLLDISAGGLAFTIPTDEEPIYHVGQILKDLKLTIKGSKITTQGEIRHMKSHVWGPAKTRGIKIGVQFKGLPLSDSQIIAMWVTEESRKYFMKLLG